MDTLGICNFFHCMKRSDQVKWLLCNVEKYGSFIILSILGLVDEFDYLIESMIQWEKQQALKGEIKVISRDSV